MNGRLSIVATPIGNLGDISSRSLEILGSVDYILCEDTRVTQNILKRNDIDTPTISYHQHSEQKKVDEIVELLASGHHLALVSDAGTPGISDPGNKLIETVLTQVPDVTIEPIPGPSAVVTALSVSGFPTDKFLFLGFPPHKKGRNKYFEQVASSDYTVAFYESMYRIRKTLVELGEVLDPNTKVCVCRELTKKFETIYRGTLKEVLETDIKEKGEFVVVISKHTV